MPGPSRSWLRLAVAAALAASAAGQQCYYPNGDTAGAAEKPCSSAEGSACCPELWQCLDNGLCYYPKEQLYGRYSCTDKSWNSPGCPSNMCTNDMTASGGESITQCSNHDDNWCCNADNVHVKCCQESPAPRPFFALQDGRAYATIGGSTASTVPVLNTITGLVSGTGTGTSPSRTSAPTTSAAGSSPPATSAAPSRVVTSLQTSVSSGPAGVETLTITNVITQGPDPTANTAGNNPQSGGGSSSNIGLIVGCAVGIPLALALIGIVFWMLRKRRQQKANPYKETADLDNHDSPGFTGGAAAKLGKNQSATYRHSRPGTAEIDGQPVGPGRPISTVKGHAELPSGTEFQSSHNMPPFAPDTVGLGGGSGNPDRSTWGSVPPQYSPANQSTFSQYQDVSELDGTSAPVGMAPIQEKVEGSQAQVLAQVQAHNQDPQVYQAYKPPPAELPTVKTPPEEVEKQISHK